MLCRCQGDGSWQTHTRVGQSLWIGACDLQLFCPWGVEVCVCAGACAYMSVCERASGWIHSFFDGKAERCLPSSLLSQSIKWTVSYLKSASLSRTKSCKSESMERVLQRHTLIKHYGKKRKENDTWVYHSHNQTTFTATKHNKQNNSNSS